MSTCKTRRHRSDDRNFSTGLSNWFSVYIARKRPSNSGAVYQKTLSFFILSIESFRQWWSSKGILLSIGFVGRNGGPGRRRVRAAKEAAAGILADFGRFWQILADFGWFWKILADFGRFSENFRRFVLGCIDSYDCENRRILQIFSRSTRSAHFCTNPNATF